MMFVFVAETTRTAERDADASLAGETKEGAGTGRAFGQRERAGASMAAEREGIEVVYDSITDCETPEVEP